jgi:hypothetical protein
MEEATLVCWKFAAGEMVKKSRLESRSHRKNFSFVFNCD